MKTLTRAEEQIMQVLWGIGGGFIRDVMEAVPQPRPHQNTVATILKILVEKEFVGTEAFGRQYRYKPLVSKESYSKASFKNLVKGYFSGSFTEAVSFMVKEKNLSVEELEALVSQLKKDKK